MRSTSSKRIHQLRSHVIDDNFLILAPTKDILRLARLQDVCLPFLEDAKFHSRPNLQHNSFKSKMMNISPTLKILFVVSSINTPLTRKQESSIRQNNFFEN